MPPAPKPKNEAAEKIKAARLAQLQAQLDATLRLANDFVAVFGLDGKRSRSQLNVLRHLYLDGNAFQFGAEATGDGITQIIRAAHRDGAQSQYRIIERQLSIAKNPPKIPF